MYRLLQSFMNRKGGSPVDEYRTIKTAACDAFVERKSRFIGYAKPVTTQQQAVDFILFCMMQTTTLAYIHLLC